MNKNYGLNLQLEEAHRSEEDYVFGSFSPICIATIPREERRSYLPIGEVQRGRDDMMDCATRGPINILEIKFNWLYRNNKISAANKQWLSDKGYVQISEDKEYIQFSDAFIAIKSGTTQDGNSLKAPLQAINDHGLIPKKLMPLEPWMTFADYHDSNRITAAYSALGKEFKARFPIYYDKVYESHFGEIYDADLLDLAGFAWPVPVNGEYPYTEMEPNHVFVGLNKPKHTIYDNYIDSVDGDFIKKLAENYGLLPYGYRIYITENKNPQKKSLWDIIQSWLKI